MFTELLMTLSQMIEPAFYLLNPEKRIFWLYLLSSAIIACIALKCHGTQSRHLLNTLFSPSKWLTPSSWLDIKWIMLNHLVRVILVVPIIGSQISLALWFNKSLYSLFGEGNFITWGILPSSMLFTFALFICEDFSRFLVHYLYHKVPFLWRFHAVHHSAVTLTPLTLYRMHSIEMIINTCRSLIIIGGLSGVFIYIFNGSINRIDILGASVFSFLFNLAGANLRHSHIWIGFGYLEKIFISPAQHQIHHSTAKIHTDKNFGSTLALWDIVFNSWLASKKETVKNFGLSGKKVEQKLIKQITGI